MPSNVAAWLNAPNAYPVEIKEAPYPNPGATEVVIKNAAVAINPIDWMIQSTEMSAWVSDYPIVIGSDLAGTIESVGSSVTRFKVGDRVNGDCDPVFTKNPAHGSYQRYTLLDETRVAHIPDKITFEEACVLPGALHTATLLLFDSNFCGLSLPKINTPRGSSGAAVLIWGGSSSVGSCCIQVARAAGYEVVTTASKRNHDYCKELGASQVFDYKNAETIVDDLVGALKGKKLVGAIDSVAQEATQATCQQILKTLGGLKKLCTVLPARESEDVETVMVNSLYMPHIEEIWSDYLPRALEANEILPKPEPLVIGTGLDCIQTGIDKSKAGVSAGKIVVKL